MPQRNHLIDLARVGSMLIVVIFHTLLWQILFVDGQIQIVPWAPGPVWWAISWICTIIPVFFVAAGYSNAVVVDTWRATSDAYAGFLTLRGTKLLGPLTLFVLVFTTIGSLAAWLGWPEQAAALSRQFAQLLWFLVTYLLLLAAAPLAVWVHDHWGGWIMLPLLAGVIAVDVAVRLTGNLELQWVNLLFAWPLAHQWGIAYHRGWFRGWRVSPLLGLLTAGAALIAVLVIGFGYPAAAVAWADIPVANLLPPTLVIVVLGWCQTVVLALLEKAGTADRLRERTARGVRLANALLLSVYLWHIPVIVMVGGILAGLTLLWPAGSAVLLNPLLLVILVLAAVTGIVPLIARVEVRLIPTPGPGSPSTPLTLIGFAAFVVGIWAVWQFGAVLAPIDPAGATAVMTYLVGAGLLWRATTRTSG
ncbi:MAG TPA: hypothetical protein DCM67_03485 [Propionibacteriaceae bacterium]|nr:hypothetical protein [Propionibacteriaceae bacterium]